jgi:hypothetical protein
LSRLSGNTKKDLGVSVEEVNRRLYAGTATALLLYALSNEDKERVDPGAIASFMTFLEESLTKELQNIEMSYLKLYRRLFIRLGPLMFGTDPVRTRIREEIQQRKRPLFSKRRK